MADGGLSLTISMTEGGVEHWIVSGKSDELVDVKMKPLLTDGTFNWPFE